MDCGVFLMRYLLLFIFGRMLAFGFVNQEERKCKYTRVEKLLRIRCFDMNLKEVPQYLKTSVEVLDLAYNRIKKLRRDSFQKYRDIKYLILYENMIQSVEPGTFEYLTSLQEIDLSNNALMTIPLEIFQLPSLRNLYMDSNDLQYLEQDLEALEKPIRAPLEYLNMADCSLYDLPDLGILPNLWQINVSSNPLTDLSIDKFAYMCHLSVIDLTKTKVSKCMCQQVNSHLRFMGSKIKYAPVCIETLDISVCPLPYNRTIGSETFKSCQNTVKLAEARSLWLFTAGCFGGAVLVILLVCYCVHRQRKQRAKKKLIKAAQSRKHFVISPKNAINNRREDELLRCDTA